MKSARALTGLTGATAIDIGVTPSATEFCRRRAGAAAANSASPRRKTAIVAKVNVNARVARRRRPR
jgi:uncharacterized protein (UPF0303 family)